MNFREFLSNKQVLFDGAMGSLLIDRGLKLGEIPELWNINHQSIVQEIHKNYLDSGSDAILTNTFGGSPIRLSSFQIENRIDEIIHFAVKNARNVTKDNLFVVGDIGPSGEYIEPVGKINEKDLYDSFRTQASYLIKENVDAILIETMSDLREAIQAIKAVRDLNKDIIIISSLTFNKKKKGYFTIMGDKPESSFKAMEVAGANIVGANCSLNSTQMVELCETVINKTTLPLIFQPNAGQPELVDEKVTYPESPKEFANNLKSMIDIGANIVGGCCGSNPEHIKETKKLIRR